MDSNSAKTLLNFDQCDKTIINNNLTIIFLNIRSLRKNFIHLLASINNILNNIKIIILVETNIADEENNYYLINGFNSIFVNREGRGGGIAVYIAEELEYTITKLNVVSFESIQFDIKTNQQVISFIPVYRPPAKSTTEFIYELETIINRINSKQPLIVIGDVNIDILRKSITSARYTDSLITNGLECMVNQTTREDIVHNTKSCIDHLFVRKNRRITNIHTSVVTTTISDHFSIIACLEFEGKDNDKTEVSENINKIINTKKVNNLIKNVNWNNIMENNKECETIYNSLLNQFNKIYNNSKHTLNKQLIKRNKNNVWISNESIKICNARDKLYNKWKNNKNNKTYEKDYKHLRNIANKILITEKNKYFLNEFARTRNNIKETWKIINNIMGKKVNSVDDVIKQNFKNQDCKSLCENFSVQFKQNVEKIIHKCSIETLSHEKYTISNSIFLTHASENEILNILQSINIKKGAGYDNIRPIDVRNNCNLLAPVITALINASLSEGKMPDILKTSVVRPIFKNGKKNDINNYRPISILPIMEKIIEEVVVRRLNSFLNRYNVINEKQFGFQKGKSINKLLGGFTNHINKGLSKNMSSLVLFVDFSKAFDTISHSKLLLVLERNGIRGTFLKWFENYLLLRRYSVQISDERSSEQHSLYGVPQGSKLGPILFLLYANEIHKILKNSTTFAYADDTAIVVTNSNIQSAINMMQNELNTLNKWCHDNGIIINASKTKLIHIRPPHICQANINLIFHNIDCLHTSTQSLDDKCRTSIELVNDYKYLGVIVDHNFKWKSHIEFLHKKLQKTAYALYHLKNCAPFNVLKQAYQSLSESYIRYGIVAWGNSTHIKTIQNIQYKLIKILMKNNNTTQMTLLTQNSQITNSPLNARQNNNTYDVTSFMKTHRLLTVKSILNITLFSEFHKDAHFLNTIDHPHQTRRRCANRYKIPAFKNNYGKNSLEVQLPTFLNSVHSNILILNKKYKQKNEIKLFLLNSQ